MEVGSLATSLSFPVLSLTHLIRTMSSPTNSNTDALTRALEKMASKSKEPSKKTLRATVREQQLQIEAAKQQGYSWEEIAQEIKHATEAAFPDDPQQVVDIAPATLRKYIYALRKEEAHRQKPSRKAFSANPFNQSL